MNELLFGLAVVFVVAGALLAVANQFGISTVPVLVVAGVVAGQFVPEVAIMDLAQWGIAFLVFVFGARVDFETLSAVFAETELTALASFLGLLAAGGAIALVMGLGPLEAAYFAAAAALSSTVVGAGQLGTTARDNLVHDRLADSIHFVQDLLAVLVLLVLSAEAFTHPAVAEMLGYGVAFLVAAAVVNRHLFGVLSRLAGGSGELMTMAAVSILVGFLAAAEALGVSIAVGAFAAGLAVRHDVSRHLEMVTGIESIRDFFVPIFFVTVGALVSVPSYGALLLAAVLVLLVAVVKPFFTVALLVREGYDRRSATLTSLRLDNTSEFALIIAIHAAIAGTISATVFDAIILAAAVTMITSAYTHRHDERLARQLVRIVPLSVTHRKTDERSDVPADLSDHVVVVGYGRQGQRVVDACEDADRDAVVVENDPVVLTRLREDGVPHVFGDAVSDYTWETAAVDDAALVVSTVDQRAVSRTVLDTVAASESSPDVFLRANDRAVARDLLDAGATYVAVPDLLAGDELIEEIERVAGDPSTVDQLRERHIDRLTSDESAGFRSLADGRKRPWK